MEGTEEEEEVLIDCAAGLDAAEDGLGGIIPFRGLEDELELELEPELLYPADEELAGLESRDFEGCEEDWEGGRECDELALE